MPKADWLFSAIDGRDNEVCRAFMQIRSARGGTVTPAIIIVIRWEE